jgi:hypothetical protein
MAQRTLEARIQAQPVQPHRMRKQVTPHLRIVVVAAERLAAAVVVVDMPAAAVESANL